VGGAEGGDEGGGGEPLAATSGAPLAGALPTAAAYTAVVAKTTAAATKAIDNRLRDPTRDMTGSSSACRRAWLQTMRDPRRQCGMTSGAGRCHTILPAKPR
jgi:hypothetical protein